MSNFARGAPYLYNGLQPSVSHASTCHPCGHGRSWALAHVSYIFGVHALHGRNTPVNGHSERRPNGADDLVSADPFLHLTVSFTYSNGQQIAHAFPVIATVKRRLLPYIRPSRAAHSVGCWPW